MDYYINNNAKVENKLSRDSVISFQIPSTSTDFTEMADENDSDLEESDMIEIQPSTSTDNIAPMKRKVEKAKWSKDEVKNSLITHPLSTLNAFISLYLYVIGIGRKAQASCSLIKWKELEADSELSSRKD